MRKFPPLPKTISAPGGVVSVVLADNILTDGEESWGQWDSARRVIQIDRSASPRHQWWTFFHECHHVALSDSGHDELYSKEAVEGLCNASAHFWMRQRFG